MSHTLTRRDFARAALLCAAGAPAAVAAPTPSTGTRTMHPVTDAHVHLWDLGLFRLPWMKPDAPFAKNHLIADYTRAIEGAGVTRAVYMEVDVDPAQTQAEADWIAGVCGRGDSVFRAAVVGGKPGAEGFADYARQFRGHKYVKGFRQVLHATTTPAGYSAADNFVAGVRLLGELGLTFDLCMRQKDLADATALAGRCPDTRFVLDHCGNPEVHAADRTAWKRDLEAVSKRPNVACKISGILATSTPGRWTVEDVAPVVNYCLDTFGPDRVIFASDWPVCHIGGTHRQWLDAVRQAVSDRPADQQRKLFHDNAGRVYGLD